MTNPFSGYSDLELQEELASRAKAREESRRADQTFLSSWIVRACHDENNPCISQSIRNNVCETLSEEDFDYFLLHYADYPDQFRVSIHISVRQHGEDWEDDNDQHDHPD